MIGYIIVGALVGSHLVKNAVHEGVKSDQQRYEEIRREISQPWSVGEELFMCVASLVGCLGVLAFGVFAVITLIGELFK